MTTPPQVRDYLAELRSSAADRLDPARSSELVDEIREHIEAAIEAGQPTGDVLRRLGRPAEIVGAEAPALAARPGARLRVQEIAAITLLLIGLPLVGFGWILGVVLLWASDRWTTRDKLIGTLLWPGGLGAFLFIGFAGPVWMNTSTESCDSAGQCTVTGSSGPPVWVGAVILISLIIVPILTSIHLARAARVPPATR